MGQAGGVLLGGGGKQREDRTSQRQNGGQAPSQGGVTAPARHQAALRHSPIRPQPTTGLFSRIITLPAGQPRVDYLATPKGDKRLRPDLYWLRGGEQEKHPTEGARASARHAATRALATRIAEAASISLDGPDLVTEETTSIANLASIYMNQGR